MRDKEVTWGAGRIDLLGLPKTREQDRGERRRKREHTVLEYLHSLKSPPNPVGRHMGEPYFYRYENRPTEVSETAVVTHSEGDHGEGVTWPHTVLTLVC